MLAFERTRRIISRMFHIAFGLLANTLVAILRLLRDSSIISLLMLINLHVFKSVVSGKIVLVETASWTKGIVSSPFPEM